MTRPAIRGSGRWSGLCATILLVAGALVVPGSARAPGAPTGPGPTFPIGPRVVVAPGFAPGPEVRRVGVLPATTSLSALVGLPGQDPEGLAARVTLEETPGSPLYHAFLSAAQLERQYGPAPTTLERAERLFAAGGLTATPSPDDRFLELSGPAGAFDRVFATTLTEYDADGHLEYAHPTAASLPAGIAWTGVLGLGDTDALRPALAGAPLTEVVAPGRPATGSCPVNETDNGYSPCQIARAYNASVLFSSGINGTGYRIAVVDAYDSAEPQTQLARDLASFSRNYSLPVITPEFVYPDPTDVNLNTSASSGWGDEEALDIEWAHASAPGATVEMVFSPDASVGLYDAVDWLVAHQAADVISLSWGEPDVGVYDAYSMPCSDQCNATTDGSYTILHPVLEDAAAEGIGVFAASGDCGASGGTSGVSPDFPASDPYVTGVGGTILRTSSTTGAWASESGWSGNSSGAKSPGCVNQGGSGGGFSPYPRPSWQSGPGISANQTGRGVPDVAAAAGGAIAIYLDGNAYGVGGTSAATPDWAGFELLADQENGADLGSLNPSLYALARGSDPGRYFHDITTGNNGYAAGPGWDPVTGLGSPNEAALASAVARVPPAPGGSELALLGVTPRLGPAPLNVTFEVTGVAASAPAFVDLAYGDGNASLVPLNGSTNTTAGNLSYTYARAGAYAASATYVDAAGNSSTSSPLVVVVGGGHSLNVSLGLSDTTPAVGASVTLTASVHDGTAPYEYDFYFGDGTYAFNRSSPTITHAYGAAGAYCASVVVRDAGRPVDGGTNVPVAVTVGGGTAAACPNPSVLTASFSSALTAGDLPGDFPLATDVAGGTPPYSVQYVSDDPYVRACDCGIFRTPGNHTITAYVNDSLDQELVRTLNVTVYPALVLTATATPLAGVAPLNVSFAARWSGGHFVGAGVANFSFGDGNDSVVDGNGSANVSHVYERPGVYLAAVHLVDQGGGSATEAWIVDVTNATAAGVVVTGSITPNGPPGFGTLYTFRANATGASLPLTYRWSFGQNDSAFGAEANQSFSDVGCLGSGSCPWTIGLAVGTASGTVWNASLVDPFPFFDRTSGAVFDDSGEPVGGTTPFIVHERAAATGVLGLTISWSLPGGGTATGPDQRISYYDPGNYTLLETARDPFGDLLVRSHAIAVTGPPVLPLTATVAANVTAGIAPLAVGFTAAAAGGTGYPYAVNWSFGDGFSESVDQYGTGSVTVNHTYAAAGIYAVTATISDPHGDLVVWTGNVTAYATTIVQLLVVAAPAASVEGSPVTVTVRANASCTSNSVPGCSNDSVGLDLYLAASNTSIQGLSPTVVGAPALFGGWGNWTLPDLANRTGPVWIWAVANGPNYTGAGMAEVVVAGPACDCGGTSHAPALDPFVVILAASTGGAALVVAAVLLLRRRRGPQGPPAEVPPGPPTPPSP